jgi:copper chaperone CopZ
METLKFKTTIKCSGCVATVTPFLNKAVGEDNWEVDINTPDKVLTIATDSAVNPVDVVQAVEVAGYKAEKLN